MAAAKEALDPKAHSPRTRPTYRFGPFFLDPAEGTLIRVDKRVLLPPKAFEALVALVEGGGQPIENTRLMQRIWPGAEVDESLLKFTMSQVRMAIGEDGYIETLAPLGYRFIADVRRIDVALPDPPPDVESAGIPKPLLWGAGVLAAAGLAFVGWHFLPAIPASEQAVSQPPVPKKVKETPKQETRPEPNVVAETKVPEAKPLIVAPKVPAIPVTPQTGKSLAVLPFRSKTSRLEEEALGAAVTEGLMSRIETLPGVRMRPLEIANQKPGNSLDAAKKAGVDAVLEGWVSRAGGNFRIVTEVRQTSDGQPILSETFEGAGAEIPKLEGKVAEKLAAALEWKPAPAEAQRLTNPPAKGAEAYRLYAEAAYYRRFTGNGPIRRAIGNLEKAIQLDPKFSRAYAALADSYWMLASYAHAPVTEVMPKSKDAAERALELDANLAGPQIALGRVSLFQDWDVASAEKHARQALIAAPNSIDAHNLLAQTLLSQSRFEEAIAAEQRAAGIEPSARTHAAIGNAYYYARQFDKAVEENRKALALDPSNSAAVTNLAACLRQQGKTKEAFDQYLRADELAGVGRGFLENFRKAFAADGFSGYILKRMAVRRKQTPAGNAIAFLDGGDKGKTFEELEKAVEARSPELALLHVTPAFDAIKDDPRFRDIVKRIRIGN